MENLNENSVYHANILYFLVGIILITIGSLVQRVEIYSGLLITQYILILFPNLMYMRIKKLPLKKSLRLNKISFKQVLYIVGITIFAYPIAVFLNLAVIIILESFGELAPAVDIIPRTFPMYLLSLFIIGLGPGICEEVMFRGTIMNAYGKLSRKKAIIYSAVLFGIFHLNMQNLVGPILLGIIFGITVYKTNSIYSSIIGHTLNNSIAMTIGYFAFRGQESLMEIEAQAVEVDYEAQLLVSLITVGIIAMVSYFILRRLIKNLPTSVGANEELEDGEREEEYSGTPKFLVYLPVLGIVLLFIIVNVKFLYV